MRLAHGMLGIWLLATGAAADPSAASQSAARAPDAPLTVSAGRFGAVSVYPPAGPPKSVALFVSGDGGWNLGVIDMAEKLRADGALVAGIDITHYFAELERSKASCEYLGAEFERLSQLVQQRAGLAEYQTPILVGYSSGATLVYALLNQTPKGVFAGGLSLGFCPDLELAKPLCKGDGLVATKSTKHKGIDLTRVAAVPAPWVALQGERDQVCSPSETARFVEGMGNAQLVSLPRVGHGYSVPANWLPQFRAAYGRIAPGAAPRAQPASAPPVLGDLPLVEVPASAGQSDEFVVLITGDGGWAGMDQDLAAGFAARGRPTVALNSLKYFWSERKPEQVAKDLDRIIRHYAASWKKPRVVLVGYSMGADAMPFAINRLPPETRAVVRAAALIGISDSAVFEFKLANWLSSPKGTPTRPEVEQLNGVRVVCIYGKEEADSLCPSLPRDRFRLVELPGAHHFNGDYPAVVAAVLRELAS